MLVSLDVRDTSIMSPFPIYFIELSSKLLMILSTQKNYYPLQQFVHFSIIYNRKNRFLHSKGEITILLLIIQFTEDIVIKRIDISGDVTHFTISEIQDITLANNEALV